MKKLSLLFTALLAAVISAQSMTIAEAIATPQNTNVTTEGYVTFIRGNRNVYLQDTTGAVLLFTSSTATCKVGDFVQVTGKNALYGGAPEISNAQTTAAQAGFDLPEELTISLDELLANPLQHFAERVYVPNVTVAKYDANGNLYVTNGADTVQCYYVSPDQNTFPVGTAVDLHLIAGYYNKLQFVGPITGIVFAGGEDPVDVEPDTVLLAVDLGLPSGRKWANMNVGAQTSYEYGSYFQWGCTAKMQTQGWDAYCHGTQNALTKYCMEAAYGTADGLTELESVDDAATYWMGGSWRIPTKEEAQELWNNCSHVMEAHGLLVGYRFTGPNGNSIFLPCNGWMGDDGSISEGNAAGQYWTSTLYEPNSNGAWGLIVRNYSASGVVYGATNRCYSRGIRAVYADPTIADPDYGTLRIVIEIPENTACNGIALKGTMDGISWSVTNTYLGEAGAQTPVSGNIYRFVPIEGYPNCYAVDIPCSTELQFKVSQIYTDDQYWDGQATDVALHSNYPSTIQSYVKSADGQFYGFNAQGGLLCLSIGGWQQSECNVEPLVERTIILTIPECGKEWPTIVGSFNGWDPMVQPMTHVAGNTYTYTVSAKASDLFKFASASCGWDNEICKYDSLQYGFYRMGNMTFGDETGFVFDFSDPNNYKWISCLNSERSLDAELVIDGDFSDWANLPGGTYAHSYSDENAIYQNLYDIKFVGDNQYVAFYVEYSGEDNPVGGLGIYMNTDGNPHTGMNVWYWRNSAANYMLENWMTDIDDYNYSNAELYGFLGEDQTSWNWNYLGQNVVYASDTVVLPNGHIAFEAVIKRNQFPEAFQRLTVGAYVSDLNWSEAGVLPEMTEGPDGFIFSPLMFVPLYGNSFISLPKPQGTCGENLTWEISADTLYIHGTGDMTDYPAYQTPWIDYCDYITAVVMDEGVTSVGTSAFRSLQYLTFFSMPNSVTRIGGYAFVGCSALDTLKLPNVLTTIGNGAFINCASLKSLRLPATIDSIGSNAFAYCHSMTDSLIIPAGLTRTGRTPFLGCSNVCAIVVEEGNPVFDSRNNCNALIRTATNELVLGCAATVIPADIESLGEGAFSHCYGLTEVTIPASVSIIRASAFEHCYGITSVVIPDNVNTVGDEVFWYCTNLVSATLPAGLTAISLGLFATCTNLASVNIPQGVTSIGYAAFSECYNLNLTELPAGLTHIDNYAFYDCYLINPTIPASVEYIGVQAFYGCHSLTTVNIPVGVTAIPYGAFWGCYEMSSVTIPEGVTSIGESAFAVAPATYTEGSYSSLTSIVIPNSVDSIGNWAFANCPLQTVVLGSGLSYLGYDVFERCANIESITCYAEVPPTVDGYSELVYFAPTILYVPAASLTAYQAHEYWGQYDVRPIGGTDLDLIGDGSAGQMNMSPTKSLLNGQLILIAPDGTRFDTTGKRVQ